MLFRSTELTSDTGVYEFPEVLAGDYTVTPSFNDSIPMMIITPYDASLTAQFSLSLHAFTTDQQIAADVTGNGSATAYDASFMAQYSVGLIDTFAAGRWSFNPTSITYDLTSNFGSQNYLGICIGDPSGNWSPESTRKSTNSNYFTSGSEIPQNYEGKISIPISFDNEFYSVVAKLSYDNTMIQFEDITQNSILNDFEIYTNDTGNNVYFGGFGLESISSPQDLFAINFITKTPLTSYRAITIDYILFDETVGGTARFETEGNIIPEKFVNSLIQNYPNPFSSETQIEFSISKETNVTIEVFNIKGQKVKTVVEENLDSGRYTRNLIMGELQSGIYFYKMVTDKGFSQIRKLILIK